MKRKIYVTILALLAVPAFADFWFVAKVADGTCIKSVSTLPVPSDLAPDVRNSAGKVVELRYLVAVTAGEFAAGWPALAQAKKDAAKAAAESERTDFELQFEKLLKAWALVQLDDSNKQDAWLTAFKASVAASTSLADFKTRVALLPAMPTNSPAQFKTAIRNKYHSLP